MSRGLMPRASAVLVCLALGVPAVSAATWLEARNDDFILVTDAKEATARATLRDFAVFKQALRTLAPLTRSVPRVPTRMYSLDSSDWRNFGPGKNVVGFFADRPQLNYIVFDRTPDGGRSREVVFHEYMHFVLHNGSTVALPTWWDEGVAEVFSTIVDRDGKVEFGRWPRSRRMDFTYGSMLSTQTMLVMDYQSKPWRDPEVRSMFYAQSWLMAHYMLIGKPERGRHMGRYLQERDMGTPVPEAVSAAFGVDIGQLDDEIKAYRDSGRVLGYRMTLTQPLPDARDFAVRVLPEGVALSRLALANLDLRGNTEVAERYLGRAFKAAPDLPLANAVLAATRVQQDRGSEATALARRALAAPAADDETVVTAAAALYAQVLNELTPGLPKSVRSALGEEDSSESEDDIAATDDRSVGLHSPSVAQTGLLREARGRVAPFAAHPDFGLGVTVQIARTDLLLHESQLDDTLKLVQTAVTSYPTSPELAEVEAQLCQALDRRTAALASISRAARYARSPAQRRFYEAWAVDLESQDP